MSIFLFFFGVALIALITITALFFIILFHEIGHALPILAISKSDVTILIGSYNNYDQSAKIRIRRLTIYIKYNPLTWVRGICQPPKEPFSINSQIFYVLCGPLTSIVSGILCYLIFTQLNSGVLRFLLGLFALFSVFNGIMNLVPRTISKTGSNGGQLISDGKLLAQLLRRKFLPSEYGIAAEYYSQKKYVEAASVLAPLVNANNKNKHVLRLAISANLMAKEFLLADSLSNIFLKKHIPNSEDYCNAGYIKNMLHENESALSHYKKSLALNSGEPITLSNMGHTLNELNRYPEALPYLEAAISMSPKFLHAHCNLALAKINIGDLDGGLQDIEYCLELDQNFADAYACLGVYHMKKNEWTEARHCFEKSKELNPTVVDNDKYLKEIEGMIDAAPSIFL